MNDNMNIYEYAFCSFVYISRDQQFSFLNLKMPVLLIAYALSFCFNSCIFADFFVFKSMPTIFLIFRISEHSYSDSGDNDSNASNLKERKDTWGKIGNFLQVQLPNNQTTMVPYENGMTVNDLVLKSCEKRHLQAVDHFLMLLLEENESGLMGN